MQRSSSAELFLLAFLAAAASAQSPDPAAWPARDAHEGLLVAADPYAQAARAKEKFGKKHPVDHGILPVEVVFRNDNDKPILVELDSIRLLLQPPGGERQQLDAMTMEDVFERMLYKHGPDMSMPRYPLPRTKPKASKSKEYLELESKIRPFALEMSLVPPKTTVRGFLFFYLGRRMDAAQNARLYLPDVKYMHNKQPLFFFEVDLSKATQ
jgi:hypothetical protein